jgi:hypothetical protein
MEVLRKKWNILRNFEKKMEHFEKNPGPTRTSGRGPFAKNPTDLVPLFVRLSKCKKLLRNLCITRPAFSIVK